ncbi:MAG: ABC transporter substrate-binding protein [Dehalococcoidia bacterium]
MTKKQGLLNRRQLFDAALTGAAGITLMSCGGAKSGGTKGASSAAGVNASATQTKEQPRKGGTLRIAQVGDISFQSVPWLNDPAPLLLWTVFEPVVRYRHDLTPELVLVDKFEYNADKTKLTMSLLSGLQFHDGSPVTAGDVLFAVDVIKNPTKYGASTTQLAGFVPFLADVTKIDDRTVEFTFTQPRANMNDFFAQLTITKATTYGDLLKGKNVQGTGVYKLDSWQPGKGYSLSANKNWHGTAKEGGPYLDGIDVKLFADLSAVDLAIQSGDIDLTIGGIAPSNAVKYRDKHQTYVPPTTGVTALICNVTNPQLQDKRVRQALLWALDKERIHKQAYFEFAALQVEPWPKTSPAYDPALDNPHFDPEKAKSLLKQAGFSQSEPISLEFINSGDNTLPQIIQQNLDSVGVKIKLLPEERTDWLGKWIKGQLSGLWIYGLSYAQMTPVSFFEQSVGMRPTGNPSHFTDSDYSQLVKDLDTADPFGAHAKDLYKAFNNLWFDQAFAVAFAGNQGLDVASKKVHGFGDYFLSVFFQRNFAPVWIEA